MKKFVVLFAAVAFLPVYGVVTDIYQCQTYSAGYAGKAALGFDIKFAIPREPIFVPSLPSSVRITGGSAHIKVVANANHEAQVFNLTAYQAVELGSDDDHSRGAVYYSMSIENAATSNVKFDEKAMPTGSPWAPHSNWETTLVSRGAAGVGHWRGHLPDLDVDAELPVMVGCELEKTLY